MTEARVSLVLILVEKEYIALVGCELCGTIQWRIPQTRIKQGDDSARAILSQIAHDFGVIADRRCLQQMEYLQIETHEGVQYVCPYRFVVTDETILKSSRTKRQSIVTKVSQAKKMLTYIDTIILQSLIRERDLVEFY